MLQQSKKATVIKAQKEVTQQVKDFMEAGGLIVQYGVTHAEDEHHHPCGVLTAKDLEKK